MAKSTLCIHCHTDITEWKGYLNYADMVKHRECFKCNHFMTLYRHGDKARCFVALSPHDGNRNHYTIGTNGPDVPSFCRGYGGSKFVVKFNDGRTVETVDLWHQGEIPEHLYAYFPVTAAYSEA